MPTKKTRPRTHRKKTRLSDPLLRGWPARDLERSALSADVAFGNLLGFLNILSAQWVEREKGRSEEGEVLEVGPWKSLHWPTSRREEHARVQRVADCLIAERGPTPRVVEMFNRMFGPKTGCSIPLEVGFVGHDHPWVRGAYEGAIIREEKRRRRVWREPAPAAARSAQKAVNRRAKLLGSGFIASTSRSADQSALDLFLVLLSPAHAKALRKCTQCRNYFASRQPAKFCSDPCRFAFHRNRQR